jgi:arylsulfatase A-like enzyme
MLAKGGVRFTNGYATSATCTPSRYALLTGVYPWRNKDAKILTCISGKALNVTIDLRKKSKTYLMIKKTLLSEKNGRINFYY